MRSELSSTASKKRIEKVREYADNVLKYGRDCYAGKRGDGINTPLFADGLNISTKEHIKWQSPRGDSFVVSNLVKQQNLFRILVGITNFTGLEKYKRAAVEAIKYHFNYFQDISGLLQWGGHRVINLEDMQVSGNKSLQHELKNAFPYYELMYEVSPENTIRFIKGFWNAHVFDWENLEISRHGEYGKKMGELWDHSYNDPEPFRETIGLSFLNAGNDLIYSAAMLYKLSGDTGALKWAKRLAEMYVKARHPKTKLGSYQYTQAVRRDKTDDYSRTTSNYGDRARRQFGQEFGEIALEGNMIFRWTSYSIYVKNVLMELQIADDIGEEIKEFYQWVFEGLEAYLQYAYLSETNMFKPLLADGTDLSGFVLPRDGYYGQKGRVLKPFPADSTYFYSYSRAYQVKKDLHFWQLLRNIAFHYNLGDIGKYPGNKLKINYKTDNKQGIFIFGLLSIYKATAVEEYLYLAAVIAENIICNNFIDEFFVTIDSNVVLFDAVEPLAILALEAELMGKADKLTKL